MTQRPAGGAARIRAWAQLLRVSAASTVPGDALAGAAALGRPANGRTLLAAGASLCLYEAGMALNDWADRDIDAVERPHRPLPSGRVAPRSALAAAGGLTAAGLALAACTGRRALLTAGALAGTVWAYDLRLKHTSAGPAAMASARALDLCLGAAATAGRAPEVQQPRAQRRFPSARVPAAAGLLGAHTYAVTTVSRHETEGGSALAPLAALATTAAVATVAAGSITRTRPARLPAAFAAVYALSAARPLLHAALNPSPPLLQQAVGGGIRATVPLQAALAARAGAPHLAVPLLASVPLARRLSRKVSPT